MFLFSFGAQLSLSLVLISHVTYFGAQMSYISVLISHIANFGAHFAYLHTGAQLSVFLVLKTHFVHFLDWKSDVNTLSSIYMQLLGIIIGKKLQSLVLHNIFNVYNNSHVHIETIF